jgi:hypothetical protein
MTALALAKSVTKSVTAVDIFRARSEARALLWQAGVFDLGEAVDVLQAAAVASGVMIEFGQDAVQAIMAEAFEKVRQ